MRLIAACALLALTSACYAGPTQTPPPAANAGVPYPVDVCTSLDTVRRLNEAFDHGGFAHQMREYIRLRESAVWAGQTPPCFTLMYTARQFKTKLVEQHTEVLGNVNLFYRATLMLRHDDTTYYAGFTFYLGKGYGI